MPLKIQISKQLVKQLIIFCQFMVEKTSSKKTEEVSTMKKSLAVIAILAMVVMMSASSAFACDTDKEKDKGKGDSKTPEGPLSARKWMLMPGRLQLRNKSSSRSSSNNRSNNNSKLSRIAVTHLLRIVVTHPSKIVAT